jgi:hypothetical protein
MACSFRSFAQRFFCAREIAGLALAENFRLGRFSGNVPIGTTGRYPESAPVAWRRSAAAQAALNLGALARRGHERRLGTAMHPRNVRRILHGLLDAAQPPRILFHDLRHSFHDLRHSAASY